MYALFEENQFADPIVRKAYAYIISAACIHPLGGRKWSGCWTWSSMCRHQGHSRTLTSTLKLWNETFRNDMTVFVFIQKLSYFRLISGSCLWIIVVHCRHHLWTPSDLETVEWMMMCCDMWIAQLPIAILYSAPSNSSSNSQDRLQHSCYTFTISPIPFLRPHYDLLPLIYF